MKKNTKISLKTNKKNKLKTFILLSSFIILISLFWFIFYFVVVEDLFSKKAEEYAFEGKYSTASKFYNASSFIKNIYFIKLKKNKDYYSVFENQENYIQMLVLRGNVSKAIKEYKKEIENVKKNLPNDEEMTNFLNLNLANCYSTLGYYDKSIPIYKSLESWYPQNLIKAYIETKEYDKAKAILDSDFIISKIEEGDDGDAIALGYELFDYYKATKQYEKATINYNKVAPDFEISLIMPLKLADLYFLQNNFEKAKEMYEKVLTNNDFSNQTRHKILINYAIVLNSLGDTNMAKDIFDILFQEQKELYKNSPEIICTNFYAEKIFNNKKYLNTAENKFKSLNLTKDSYFYNDLEYFCTVNKSY